MITAKDAVQKAAEYLQGLIPIQPGRTPVVEEIEKDGPNWLVTLSYVPPSPNPYALALGQGAGKEYKRFEVKGDNGEIVSMKIRTLN